MSKAQLSSMELIIGVFVFMVIFVFLFSTFNSYNNKLNNNLEDNEKQRLASQVTDSLIKTQGIPEDWESNNLDIKEIGLVNKDRIINQTKLMELEDIDYNELKSIMNIQKYDFNLTIKFSNNDVISGVGVPITGKKITTTRRFAVYNKKEAIIDLTLF
ncbi:hypothetical protein HYX17_04705 [Candidatus Woesearchaeota archaeon]|nr:hypothetical protein [Candidatus Woesearchaeota archaeon]